MDRVAAFISHSFARAPEYIDLLDMFERQGLAIVNRSVPAWSPLDVDGQALRSALDHRIRTSSRVVVLVTEQLHKSSTVRFEIETARKYGKPIIAVYPHGQFGQPMPRVLNDGLYRAVGWRGNALEKAVLGEYPADSRIFDIAEDADRRAAVHWTLGASAGAVLLMTGATYQRVEQLRHELQARGLVVPQLDRAPFVVPPAVAGTLLGILVDLLLGGRGKNLLPGALLGGGLGAAVGLSRHADAELRQLGPLLELRRNNQALTIGE
jgi:hypothetical protein